MEYHLTEHALTVIGIRQIQQSWIKRAVESPARTQPDKQDASLVHHMVPIEENENRVLRVVINTTVEPQRVVTAYFDRKLKGKL